MISEHSAQFTSSVARYQPFEASENARLLHVLADGRLISARRSMMLLTDRNTLDSQCRFVWACGVVPLFNYLLFSSNLISNWHGCFTLAAIQEIGLRKLIHEIRAQKLKELFAVPRSKLTTVIDNLNMSGKGYWLFSSFLCRSILDYVR